MICGGRGGTSTTTSSTWPPSPLRASSSWDPEKEKKGLCSPCSADDQYEPPSSAVRWESEQGGKEEVKEMVEDFSRTSYQQQQQ